MGSPTSGTQTPAPTRESLACRSIIGNSRSVTDERCTDACRIVPAGTWPCGEEWGLCDCGATSVPSASPTVAPVPPVPSAHPTPYPAPSTDPTAHPTPWPTPHPTPSTAPTPYPSPHPTPHPVPSASPTPELTSRPSSDSSNCNMLWAKCGGKGWNGATCCKSGSVCERLNPWYSQCRPSPEGADSPCSALSGQCGGIGWKGASCCRGESVCKKQNSWYSQCVRPKQEMLQSTSTGTASSLARRHLKVHRPYSGDQVLLQNGTLLDHTAEL